MSQAKNPYSNLPDHCFWSRTHRGVKPGAIDPVVKGGFKITPKMKIATAGSCFAQHIARHLKSQGYNYLVTEQAHPVISDPVAHAFGYGVFTARYGNLYTTRQLLQLAQRAYGMFTPSEDIWQEGEKLIDPFRPNIQPDGFATRQEFDSARDTHFAAVREMIETCDVFVFTFGLTEAWVSKKDGAVFPLAPGVAGGTFDTKTHAFVNFTVSEVAEDFRAFVALMRKNNPKVKILMTVSPVPLIATAREDQSVICATSYSKSVLRVACEELQATLPATYYFPSFEVITGNSTRGTYFGEDLREVEEAGVAHVMSLFMRHYTNGNAKTPSATPKADSFQEEIAKALDIICDEELIERAVK